MAEGEEPHKTDNPDILVARRQTIDPEAVEAGVGRLVVAASSGEREALWRELLDLVPDFQGHTGSAAEKPPSHPGTAGTGES